MRKVTSALAGVALGASALVGLNSAPAQADVAWHCRSYDSLLFNMVGICGKMYYKVSKNKHGQCKVHVDAMRIHAIGDLSDFERHPAIRVETLDILGGKSGYLLHSWDEVDIDHDHDNPTISRTFDRKGRWTATQLEMVFNYHMYMKPVRPDKTGTISLQVGPFKKC